MGRAQVCCDNTMTESLQATLTTEYYDRRTFTTRDHVYTGSPAGSKTSTTTAAAAPASAAKPPIE